jgi:hypothetical protein
MWLAPYHPSPEFPSLKTGFSTDIHPNLDRGFWTIVHHTSQDPDGRRLSQVSFVRISIVRSSLLEKIPFEIK